MRIRWMVAAALPLVVGVAGEARQAAAPPASGDFFEARIRPLLAANCYDCHTDQRMGGLRLDSREAMLKGGRSGPAIVPGDPDKSLLIEAVRQTNDKLKMPKGGHLKPEEIDTLAQWIRAGAPWFTLAAVAPAAAKAADAATAKSDPPA